MNAIKINNAILALTEKRTIKLDLDKEPNYVTVGSPTVKNGVISGFSSTNYALIPNVPSNVRSYEMVAKFTTGTLDGEQRGVLGNSATNKCTPQINVYIDNKIHVNHPQDADTWVSDSFGNVEANTTYTVKLAWNGSTVIGYYKTVSSDDWVKFMSKSCSTVHWIEQIGIGIDQGEYPFNGSIDLNECYIQINGNMWWSATRDITVCRMVK